MSKIPQGEWSVIAARYQNGETISKIARSYGCTPPAIHYILKRNRQRPAETPQHRSSARQADETRTQLRHTAGRDPASEPSTAAPNDGALGTTLVRASAIGPAADVHHPAAAPTHGAQAAPVFRPSARAPSQLAPTPSPMLPGLDNELHERAETAIELFRSSFDAALVERSPTVCERLRRAASDLMRVAARTTIVLDRLSGIAERSAREHNYPRSAHTPDDR